MYGIPPSPPHGHVEPPCHLTPIEKEIWAMNLFDQAKHFRDIWTNIRAHQRHLKNMDTKASTRTTTLDSGQFCLMLPSQGNPVSKLDFVSLGPFRMIKRVTGGCKLRNDRTKHTFVAWDKDAGFSRRNSNQLTSLGEKQCGVFIAFIVANRIRTVHVHKPTKMQDVKTMHRQKRKRGPPRETTSK